MKSIYIAGPMSGVKYYNFSAFDEAYEKLAGEGWDVISPANLDRECGIVIEDYPEDHDWYKLDNKLILEEVIRKDIGHVVDCDAIYMLNGWWDSKGAKAEYYVAKWAGKEILFEEVSR